MEPTQAEATDDGAAQRGSRNRTLLIVLGLVAIVVIIGAVAVSAMGGDDDDAESAGATTTRSDDDSVTTEPVTPSDGDGIRPRDEDDARDLFSAFVASTYGDDSSDETDWYSGNGSDAEGVFISVNRPTAEEARPYCDLLAPAVAYFFADFDAPLRLQAGVQTPDGNFADDLYDPIECAAAPAYEDPIVATAPAESADAIERADEFTDEYFDDSFEETWYAGFGYALGDGPNLVEFHLDEDAPDDGTHSADIAPIMAWVARDSSGAPGDYELKVGTVTCE